MPIMLPPSTPQATRTLRRTALAVALAVTFVGCGGPTASGVPVRASASSAAATSALLASSPPSSAGPVPSAPVDPSPGPIAAASGGSARVVSATVAEVARLQAAVNANPADENSQRDLGSALVQRVRESADPALYAPAMAAFKAALALVPDDAIALTGVASIQLGKHQFADALVSAEHAIALSPGLVPAYAARVDALVELGRYDEADAAAGLMFGLSSNLTTLARVSYLAELRGYLTAAVVAMRDAAASPGLAPENTAYVQALLGNLLVYSGDASGAAVAYQTAVSVFSNHAPSLAGQGRLAVAAGKLPEAMALFQQAADIVPLPEYVIALGDAQTAAGQLDLGARSYALARAEIQLFKAAGVIVDVDLALLEADHGDPQQALIDAEAGYHATPTVRAADALAWALHRLGRDSEARKRSNEALRLGSIDPILRYHAGAIAAALGDSPTARRDLQAALRTDPGFSALGAAEARRIVATLPPG